MKIVFWIAGVLLVLLGTPALVFFGLYLSTGERVAANRAVALWRWCVVVVLGTFNIFIFGRVIDAIIDLAR